MKTFSFSAFVILGLLCAAMPSQAGVVNLVNNPGFEAGLDGWNTYSGINFWNSVDSQDPLYSGRTVVSAGNYSAAGGCVQAAPVVDCTNTGTEYNGSLYQYLTTLANHTYTLAFDYNAGISPAEGSQLRVLWGGIEVFNQSDFDTADAFSTVTISDLLAVGNSTELQFLVRQDAEFIYVDQVSVIDQVAGIGVVNSETPEPGTVAMLVGGLAVIAVSRFRRCRRSE